MSKKLSPLIVALALVASPAAAFADAGDRVGAYGVVGLGKGKVTAHGKQSAADKKSKDVGSSKLAYNVGAGYRINEYLAIESDFSGTAKGKKKSSKKQGTLQRADVSSRALTVSALGIIPVGDSVELFGRVGAGQMQTKYAPGGDLGKVKARGLATQYGVGANFYLSEKSFMRIEYDVLRSRKGSEVAKAAGGNRLNNSQLTVSYGYNF
ncbi:porin family protein [Stenotrophomonas cyclobalanopsidis]|uniref:Porin family protein n=1 Tax=Stenotrophomonas cyclobalanopsidis TaxID=2771362 RepID=A0ABQ6T1N8_9GAMM|nr:porin family protein [Stenotrophomonas cyclobalanopsidis]KAA8999183.1 porin family protein [Stenotrophomonas cyclobalanopsidis]